MGAELRMFSGSWLALIPFGKPDLGRFLVWGKLQEGQDSL